MAAFLSELFEAQKIRSGNDYLAWVRKHRSARNKALTEDLDPKVARVDAGRWIIDCGCGAGNAVHPDWPLAACTECGAIHRSLVFPPQRQAIEALLSVRDERAQFWFPQETLDDLRAQNAAHSAKGVV